MRKLLPALLLIASCATTPPQTVRFGALGGRSYAAVSWGNGATLYFDPQNTVSGACASNANDCQTNTCGTAGKGPCVNAYEFANRWFGYEPIFTSTPTIVQMSAHTDNTDPVILRPQFRNGAGLIYQCSLPAATVTDTVNATVNVPKSRAGGTLYGIARTTISDGTLAGQFLIDSTVTNGSRGWVHNTNGGLSHLTTLTQMFQTPTIPSSTFNLAINETAASGDTIKNYNFINTNIVELRPRLEEYSASTPSNYLYVQNCNVWDPSGTVGRSKVDIGDGVAIYESSFTRTIHLVDSISDPVDSGCVNCYMRAGIIGGKLNAGRFFRINGGWIPSTAILSTSGLGIALDADVVVETNATMTGASINQVVLNSNITLALAGVSYLAQLAAGYSGTFIWGLSGSGDLLTANGRVGYDDSQGGMLGIFPNGFIALRTNNLTTSCNSCGATTQTITCGLTVNQTNMDTACDATHFGGAAFSPSGAGSFLSATKGGLQ